MFQQNLQTIDTCLQIYIPFRADKTWNNPETAEPTFDTLINRNHVLPEVSGLTGACYLCFSFSKGYAK